MQTIVIDIEVIHSIVLIYNKKYANDSYDVIRSIVLIYNKKYANDSYMT